MADDSLTPNNNLSSYYVKSGIKHHVSIVFEISQRCGGLFAPQLAASHILLTNLMTYGIILEKTVMAGNSP